MSSSKPLLATAVLIGACVGSLIALVSGWRPLSTLYRNTHLLRDEHARLQAQAADALGDSQRRATAIRAAVQHAGDRLGAIRTQVTFEQASHDALPTTIAHPLKFRGYDTPLHAAESFFWACYTSNPEMIARALYLDDAAQAEAEKVRASLTPEMQVRFPTAASLVGMLKAYDDISHPMPNSEDYFIGYPTPDASDADTVQGRGGLVWRRTSEGWKVEIPARKVADLAYRVLNSGGT